MCIRDRYKIRPIDNGLEIRAFLADKQKRLWVASKKGKMCIRDRFYPKTIKHVPEKN